MVRIGPMASLRPILHRRTLLVQMGALALASPLVTALAQSGSSLALTTKTDRLTLRGPADPATDVWAFRETSLRLQRGRNNDIEVRSELPAAVLLDWRGVDGAPALETLLANPALAAGSVTRLRWTTRHAGTFLCEQSPFGAETSRPAARPLPIVVAEGEPPVVDREEILLIEEWHLRPDGRAVSAGANLEKTSSIYTVNGKSSLSIEAAKFERLRLRIINGSPRTVIAIKLGGVDVRVMALDSQPAEPFLARNGAVVLPPGGRVDTFVDATKTSSILLHNGKEAQIIGELALAEDPPSRPSPLPPAAKLPSNGLPAQLDLKAAQRFDLMLQGTGWVAPASFSPTASPAFHVKRGHVGVLTLTNRSGIATVFRLHGHHFRLLDRLDDGWKPYWLDTLAFEPGQTQRIAFLAEYVGRYLLESTATDWAAPKLVRWYEVE